MVLEDSSHEFRKREWPIERGEPLTIPLCVSGVQYYDEAEVPMRSANERPERRGTRPLTILRGNRSAAASSVVALLCLSMAPRSARAAEPKAPPPSSATDASKDKAKPAATETPATPSATAPSATSAAAAATPAAATPATAATPPASAPPAAEPAQAPVEASVEAPAETPAPSVGTLPAPPGDVARLPPEAYPGQPIRGIVGGSLWLTFHGMQWPTSPFHTEVPRTQLGLSGMAWADTGFQSVTTGDAAAHDAKLWINQTRVTLRATPTYTKGDMFLQAQGELVGTNSDDAGNLTPYDVRPDDLWLRVGRWNRWDIQVGRFQAWEIYHYGMGLDQYTPERAGAYKQQGMRPPTIYGVNYLYDRPQSAGNLAFHVYPTRFLRAELLAQAGYADHTDSVGARPAVIADFGIVRLKGAVEMKFVKANDGVSKQDDRYTGGGVAAQVILDPRVEFGVNGAYGNTDLITPDGSKNLKGSVDTWSVGGFANVRLMDPMILGLGANYTRTDDTEENSHGEHGEFSQFQSFVALQALLLDQLFLKGVVAYAKADFAPSAVTTQPWTDESISARVRVMYLF